MAGMMYIPPKTNPFIGMGANFLSNLAMAGIARDWRKQDEKEHRPIEMLKAGYEQVQPEQAGTPTMVGTDLSRKQPGVVEVGGEFYKRRKSPEPQAVTFKVGDRMVPAIVTQNKDGGYDVKLVPDDKAAQEKLPTGKLQVFQEWKKNNPNGTYEQFAEWESGLNKKDAVSVKVENIGAATETSASKKYGEVVGENAAKRDKMAQEGLTQNIQLDQVKSALAKGAFTGFGAESLLDFRRVMETVAKPFGIETRDLGPEELIRKTSNEMALRLRNPESGLGLTGNTSNKDLEFLKSSVVGLPRTRRGNVMIIDSMQRMNRLKVAMAKEQQRIIKESGGKVPNDIESKLLDFVDNYKFFNDKEIKEIKRLSQPVIQTGTDDKGRKVVRLQDGSVEYAD